MICISVEGVVVCDRVLSMGLDEGREEELPRRRGAVRMDDGSDVRVV